MDTLPMPLDSLAHLPGGLDEFRITSPSQIKTMLRALVDAAVPLNINGPDGSVLGTTLWTVDPMRGSISFSASADDPHLEPIVQGNEAVVVGYLDSVKLQFDVYDLMLVHGGRQSALSCAFPSVIYRFQRRGSYRVRPIARSTPVARLQLDAAPSTPLALRVLDVSLSGCALLLPDQDRSLEPGLTLGNAEFEFDSDTRFTVDLRLHHLSSLGADAKGMRIGCEMLRMAPDAQRMLQRYIDQTQKRRRQMALE